MAPSSVYNFAESSPEKWRPGEELAASGFVAIVFYLFVELNFSIYRIFKKKQGLYYWCMLLGTWGCAIDSIAVVLKYFVPNPEHLWPLYTLFILGGWTIYAPAQLLVLYSRLHLISHNRKLHRWVLIMIIVVSSLMIIPTWVLVWPAFNPYNPRLSALYSPREAIADRCTQIGFTVAEIILSGIYIWSLAKILNLKSSVRQRRVMTDLIYVIVIALCLDILTVVLVYRNQTGISHPIQTFSYILKLKLEFLVLNQLMDLTTQGTQRVNFVEQRYHRPSAAGYMNPSAASSKAWGRGLNIHQEPSNEDSVELVAPSPTLSRVQVTPNKSGSQSLHDRADGARGWAPKANVKKYGASGYNIVKNEDEEISVHREEVSHGGTMV